MGDWEINARIGGDGTGFARVLNTADRQATAFANKLEHELGRDLNVGSLAKGFAAIFSVETIKSAIESTIAYGAQIRNVAEQLQVGTKEAQHFMIAAQETGLPEETAATALHNLARVRKEAAEGGSEAALEMRREMERFSATVEDLRDPLLTGRELLDQMGEAMQGMHLNESDKAFLINLFGQRGFGLKLPAFLKALHEAEGRQTLGEEEVERLKHYETLQKELERQGKMGLGGVITHPSALLEANMGTLGFLYRGANAIGGLFKGESAAPEEKETGALARLEKIFEGPSMDDLMAMEDADRDKNFDAIQKKLLESHEKIYESRLKRLSPGAQRAARLGELGIISRNRQAMENAIGAGQGTQEQQQSLASLQQREAELQAELYRDPQRKPGHDALAAVGGFAFSGSGSTDRHLSEISRHTKETADALKGRRMPSKGGFGGL